MEMDVYNCEECGNAFATEKGQEPGVCPVCESELYEFSHEVIVIPKEKDSAATEPQEV